MAENWGGARAGAGRKEGYKKPEGVRTTRAMRAYDDEWELLKELGKYIKKVGVEKARSELSSSIKGIR